MISDAFRDHLAELFSVGPADIRDDFRLRDRPDWDSMAMLDLMALIDDDFAVEVSGEELGKCTTLGEVFALIQRAMTQK